MIQINKPISLSRPGSDQAGLLKADKEMKRMSGFLGGRGEGDQ